MNAIDASTLESLEAISHSLKESGMELHLSEVEGPAMGQIQRLEFLTSLTGRVFLIQNPAFLALRLKPKAEPLFPSYKVMVDPFA